MHSYLRSEEPKKTIKSANLYCFGESVQSLTIFQNSQQMYIFLLFVLVHFYSLVIYGILINRLYSVDRQQQNNTMRLNI